MKNSIAVFLFLMIYISSPAQQSFIKTIANPTFGNAVRILPTNDNGWVIFTMDSLKLTKFNNCGVSQWSKHYFVPNAELPLEGFIKTSDDGFALLTRMRVNSLHAPTVTHVALVTKINAQGNIAWSKSYEDPSDDYSQVPYSISEDPEGNLIVFCGTQYFMSNNPAYNMILKINANGVLLSTKFYNFGGIWGSAIATSDNGVLIRTGSTFIKADNAGNVQWTSSFTSTSNFFSPIEVADGYIFTGYKNTSTVASFYKINKQGNLMWGGRKQTNFYGIPNLHKKSNGNIVAVFFNEVVEFDKDLNAVVISSLAGSGLYGKRICFLNDGSPVLAGFNGSLLFYAKMTTAFQTNCTAAAATTITTFNDVLQTSFNINYNLYNIVELSHIYPTDTFSIALNLICNQIEKLNIGSDTLLCYNSSLLLQNLEKDKFNFYQWSTGETTATINIDQPGIYWLKASYQTYGCLTESIIDTIVVSYAPRIITDLGADVLVCEKESYIFSAPACDSCYYYWNTGSNSNMIIVKDAGNYWLNVTDSNGCIYSDTVAFNYSKCECQMYFPNSFTPNSDGLNETFRPFYYCDLFDFNLKIFNRWGQPVFTTQNSTDSWDGKHRNTLVPTGIYYYAANFTPILKGKVGQPITRTGSLTVIY